MNMGFPFSLAVVNIIAKGNFLAVFAVQLDFADGMVYAHTRLGDLVIDGITYKGVGHLGQVSQSQEKRDSGSPTSIDLTLSGLDMEIISSTTVKGCRGVQAGCSSSSWTRRAITPLMSCSPAEWTPPELPTVATPMPETR